MGKKFINKSGFASKGEAEKAGIIAMNEYMNLGQNSNPILCLIQII